MPLMPRVILTVPERDKQLWVEAAHHEYISLAEWLRRAANERLIGTTNSGLAAGEHTAAGITTSQPEGVGHIHPDAGGLTADPSPSPAAKPCPKHAMHHIYHSGKPCPSCGYPKREQR